jgi:hypothetical protein
VELRHGQAFSERAERNASRIGAALLLVLAALLIAWGQAPERTEAFIERLPGGNYLLKALANLT